jgi:hypothetical protein
MCHSLAACWPRVGRRVACCRYGSLFFDLLGNGEGEGGMEVEEQEYGVYSVVDAETSSEVDESV